MANSPCTFAVGRAFERVEVVGEVRFCFSPLPAVQTLTYVSYAFGFDRSHVLERFSEVARFVIEANCRAIVCRRWRGLGSLFKYH